MKKTQIISILMVLMAYYSLNVYGLILMGVVFWIIPKNIRNNPIRTMINNTKANRKPKQKKSK